MYIGGTGDAGLAHLVWELIDNAVDEAAAGHANRIEVAFHPDGRRGGRQRPRHPHRQATPEAKVSALEVVLTELHAGGKFGGGAYGASGGLHGVGASVVNALSRTSSSPRSTATATPTSSRSTSAWPATSTTERPVQGPSHELRKVKRIAPKRRPAPGSASGPTSTSSTPSRSSTSTRCASASPRCASSCPASRSRLARQAPGAPAASPRSSCRGRPRRLRRLPLVGETVTEVITLTGLDTFEEKVPVDGKMAIVERECRVEVALRWVKGYDTTIVSFVNTIPTPEGGTHVAGFERALTHVVNDVLLAGTKKLAKLRQDRRPARRRSDVQEGLVAVVKVTFPEPQFRGPDQAGARHARRAVDRLRHGQAGPHRLVPGDGKKTHVDAVARQDHQRRAQPRRRPPARSRPSARAVGARLDRHARQAGRLPRRTARRASCIIVEGDSAAGPAKAGRNSEFRRCCRCGARSSTPARPPCKQVLDNAEARRCSPPSAPGRARTSTSTTPLRPHRASCADADVDGSHIRCLLLTLIYHYMRPMLEAGRVYAAQPPLYTAKVGDIGQREALQCTSERDAVTR